MRTKTIWIREEFLAQILDGRKRIEVRVGYSNIIRLQPGDRLLLNDQYPFRLVRIAIYPDFGDMLAHEEAAAIAPDVPPDQLLGQIRTIYPADKEALGAVALEIVPV